MIGMKKFINRWSSKLNQSSPSLVIRLPIWLAHFSMVLWASSLFFPALVTYSGDSVYGAPILMLGWIIALGANFAWFTNVLLIYVYVKVLSSHKPVRAVAIAVLLALMTFQLNEVPLNFGGASSPVFGYGVGAILWFLSIWVMAIAVFVKGPNKISERQTANAPLGLLAICGVGVALPVLVVFLVSQYGRNVANPMEQVRLQSAVIKRGSVCSEEVVLASAPIANLEGPLELRIHDEYSDGRYPLGEVRQLLAWGIPSVRIGSTDFSYEIIDGNALITAVEGFGRPGAVLEVTTLRSESGSRQGSGTFRQVNSGVELGINVRMMAMPGNRVVFDQDWRNEAGPGERFKCPDYSSFPASDQEPRRVVMQALGLEGVQGYDGYLQILDREGDHMLRVPLNIVEISSGGATREMKRAQWSSNNRAAFPPPSFYFNNCPDNIEVVTDPDVRILDGGLLLERGAKSYYLQKSPIESYAVCDDENIYTYVGTQDREVYEILIRQRGLDDFRINWSANLLLENAGEEVRDRTLSISKLNYEGGVLLVEITNDLNGKVVMTKTQVDLPQEIE